MKYFGLVILMIFRVNFLMKLIFLFIGENCGIGMVVDWYIFC